MATIILRKKSDKGGPYYMYTLIMTYSNRQPKKVTVDFTLKAALASSSSSDYGPAVTATIYCGSETKKVTVRGHNVRWSGTTTHSISGSMTVPVGNATTSLDTALKVVKEGGSSGELSKTKGKDLVIPKNERYKISYSGNGGTGTPGAQQKWKGETITLSKTTPKRANYTFVGWGTSKTATKKSYSPGQKYSANKSLSLYAIWKSTAGQPIKIFIPNNQNSFSTTPTVTLNGALGKSGKLYTLASNLATVANTITAINTKSQEGGDHYQTEFLGWYSSLDSNGKVDTKISELSGTNPTITFSNVVQNIYMGISNNEIEAAPTGDNIDSIQDMAIKEFSVNRSNSQGEIDDSGDYLVYEISFSPQLNRYLDTSGTSNTNFTYESLTYALSTEDETLVSQTIARTTNNSVFTITGVISVEDLSKTVDHTVTLTASSTKYTASRLDEESDYTYASETITSTSPGILPPQSFPFYITANRRGISLLDIPPENPEAPQINLGAKTTFKQGLSVDGTATFKSTLIGTTLQCTNLQHIYEGSNYAPIKFYAPTAVSTSLGSGHVYHDTTFKMPAPYKHVIGVRQINTNHQSVLQMTSFIVDGDGASGNTVKLRVHFFNRGSASVSTKVYWEVWLSVW